MPPVSTQSAKFACDHKAVGMRRGALVEVVFDFEVSPADAVRFIPMNLRSTNATVGQLNDVVSIHLTPPYLAFNRSRDVTPVPLAITCGLSISVMSVRNITVR